MKRFLLSLVAIATLSLYSLAQAPESFNYQAVVRNAGGLILNNQPVGLKLTIQQGSIGGTAVYTETFTSTTNDYGIVNLEIGTGTSTDDFSTIDWANGPFFMETAADVTGGTTYSVMGTSQLMSVPYALYAKTADSVSYLPSESFYYADADGDTFGNPLVFVYSINNPPGFTTDNTDCDDNNPAINPGATDIAGNGIDEDCDGQDTPAICGNGIVEFGEQCDDGNTNDNDGCSNCQLYQDNDNDGYYANIDCDDNNPSIFPGANEICDGIDNDCNGQVDEIFDIDGDGFTTCQGDCDDSDPNIYPGATEACGDGIDNNCNGQIDEGCLNIGDIYQGGIIFWLDGNGGGLIAAPQDQGITNWGCSGTDILGADGVAIGTGNQNTIDIYNSPCLAFNDAADMCFQLTLNGYNDWFLPSINELYQMYLNIGPGDALGLGNIGAFNPVDYWSSSETDSMHAFIGYFLNPNIIPPYIPNYGFGNSQSSGYNINGITKTGSYRVRAIRAF